MAKQYWLAQIRYWRPRFLIPFFNTLLWGFIAISVRDDAGLLAYAIGVIVASSMAAGHAGSLWFTAFMLNRKS